MNESNHTPGEWEIRDNDYFPNQKTIETDGSSRVIAVIDKSDDEDLANARLIAAAPELLAACEDLVNLWDEWARYSEGLEEPLRRSIEMRVQQSRAAIAKARGEA